MNLAGKFSLYRFMTLALVLTGSVLLAEGSGNDVLIFLGLPSLRLTSAAFSDSAWY